MKAAGLEVHYNYTGLAYSPEEFVELAKEIYFIYAYNDGICIFSKLDEFLWRIS
jgi:hypothetical protein